MGLLEVEPSLDLGEYHVEGFVERVFIGIGNARSKCGPARIVREGQRLHLNSLGIEGKVSCPSCLSFIFLASKRHRQGGGGDGREEEGRQGADPHNIY